MATDQLVFSIRKKNDIQQVSGDGAEAQVLLFENKEGADFAVGQTIIIEGTADYDGTYSIKDVSGAAPKKLFVISHAENTTENFSPGEAFAGGHFETLNEAVDAIGGTDGDLVSQDIDVVFDVYHDWAGGCTSTDQVQILEADWTTDRDHFVIIRGNPTDLGRSWSERDGPTLRANGVTWPAALNHGMIHIQNGVHVWIKDIEIDGTEDSSHSNTGTKSGISFVPGTGGGAILLENTRIHDFYAASGQRDCINLEATGSGTTLYQFRNCAFYNCDDDCVTFRGGATDDWDPVSYWDHGVAYGAGDRGVAVTYDNAQVKLRNVYSGNNTDEDFDTRATNRIQGAWGCASEDSTASSLPGSNNITGVDPTTHFNVPDEGDFRLEPLTDGNLLSNAGFDIPIDTDFPDILSENLEYDIQGDLWLTDRDIGIFEFSGQTPTSITTSASTSLSSSLSTSTLTDPPFFPVSTDGYVEQNSGDLTDGTGTDMDEVSGLCYASDRNYLVAVDDGLFIREYETDFTPIQSPVALPSAVFHDPEAIVYIGDHFTDYDFAVLDETTGVEPCKIHLFPFAPGQTSLDAADVTTFDLPKIPRYTGQTYGNEGPEGLAYDANRDLWFVSTQADTQSESGIWQVDLNTLDTDGNPTHFLLYSYVDSGIVNGTDGISSPVDCGKDLFHGSMHSTVFGQSYPRSLFMLTRDGDNSKRKVLQIDTNSGMILSEFTHSKTGQIEALTFDDHPNRGFMYIAGEEASIGATNVWEFFPSGVSSITTSASTSLSTTASTSLSTTASTSLSSSVSTSASTSLSTTASTSLSTSAVTSLSSSASTSLSSTASTSLSSSLSTTASTSLSTTLTQVSTATTSSTTTTSITVTGTTLTPPPGTPGQGTVTAVPPVDPCIEDGSGVGIPVALCLHVKIVPKYNDQLLIQHADDQINDGTIGAPICPVGEDVLKKVGQHERVMTPIGSSIESYQGFETVEVFRQMVDTDTDGNIVTSGGNPVLQGSEDLFLSERKCEQLKQLFEDPVSFAFMRFRFRLRTKQGSSNYVDHFQYVYVLGHDVCGSGGSSGSYRCDDSGTREGFPDDIGSPPNETTPP